MDVLEIDLQRGPEHDMMSDELYAMLLRGALDSRFDAVVGGPNCRTRSVLRHYPLPGGGPRPVRSPEELRLGGATSRRMRKGRSGRTT